MHNWKFLIVSLLVLASVAYAVNAIDNVENSATTKPLRFMEGFFTGGSAKNPLVSVKNRQSYHLCGTLVYDFAALGNIMAPGTTACEESFPLTITGCGFNDRVSMGIDQDYVNGFGQIVARVSAADTVKIVACGNGITDGGSFNMPDASYTVCCDGY